MRRYALLADIVAFLHFAWFGTAIFLFVEASVWHRYKIESLVFVGITVLSSIVFRGCILREWEKTLRKKENPHEVYEGTFLAYYVKKVFDVTISDTLVRVFIVLFWILLVVFALV